MTIHLHSWADDPGWPKYCDCGSIQVERPSSLMQTQPATWEAALDTVLAEMRAIMVDRQNKYGPTNITALGIHGVVSRALADKGARIMGALNGQVVRGRIVLNSVQDGSEAADTFEDGCFDAANYLGVIVPMLRRGWWSLPRASESQEGNRGQS